MAAAISLPHLIAALAGAVAEAQDAVHGHQLALIGRYFDKEGRPFCLNLTLPDPASRAAPSAGRQVVTPLLSLVDPTHLAITEFTADFEVALGSLALEAERQATATADASPPIDIPDIAPPRRDDQSSRPHRPDEGDPPAVPPPVRRAGPLRVDLAGRSGGDVPLARLSIKVEGRPAAEGLSRLVDALNKTI